MVDFHSFSDAPETARGEVTYFFSTLDLLG